MFSIPFLDIPPLLRASGTVRLPGSKSISNRVLLLAGLASGQTAIRGLLEADDTQVMLDALQVLGCGIDRIGPIDGGVVRIEGVGGQVRTSSGEIFLGNSGTASRSITAALSMLASLRGASFTLSGVPRLHERPIGDLVDALRPLGCKIDYLGHEGFLPLRLGDGAVHPLDLREPIRVRGDVSSQFLTGLLQALCLVATEQDVAIDVVGELISKPYIAITLNLLARFGVVVRNEEWARFVIPAGSRLISPGEIEVEGDASSASYFVALGAIAADPQAPLRIEGVGSASIQGDLDFVAAAEAMGARIVLAERSIEVSRGAWPLRAISLDCNDIPDAAMTLAVMALFATGTTRLTHIASWRVKETDRIDAMVAELRRLGATVQSGADFIEIAAPPTWRASAIHTYDDHRMAMCFSLAAFNGLASIGGTTAARPDERLGVPVRVLDPRCVGKTFPEYFEAFFAVTAAPPGGVPIITVDGPTASGKGTLASAVAQALGYHYLDSGVVYRATALAAMQDGIGADQEERLAQLAAHLDLQFDDGRTALRGADVTELLRLEEVGALASKVATWPAVRAALLALQLSFARVPGLVADGRDMGTVIFPDADLKVFLTASATTRAERRYRQLMHKGVSATIDGLRAGLELRDQRDQGRSASPLHPAADALLLDNSALAVEASVKAVLAAWEQRRPF